MESLPYISKIPCPPQADCRELQLQDLRPGEHRKQKIVGRKIERFEENGARLSQARFNFWL
jgi:hypothetical protein